MLRLLLSLSIIFFSVNLWSASIKPFVATSAIEKSYGVKAGKRARALNALVARLFYVPESQKLAEINDFFNLLVFTDDSLLWGKKDYWATPNEFVGVGGGDCEDFSIAKYLALRRLGVADSKLRLIYVKSLALNQFHMVVAYYSSPSVDPVILDNLDSEIKPATQRQDLVPIYSFNGQNLWLSKRQRQGSDKLAGKSSRLSSWNDLRKRSNDLHLSQPKIKFDE